MTEPTSTSPAPVLPVLASKFGKPVGFMYLRTPRPTRNSQFGFHRVGCVSFVPKDKACTVFAVSGSMLSKRDPFDAAAAQGRVVQRMLKAREHYVELSLEDLKHIPLSGLFQILGLYSTNSWAPNVAWPLEESRFRTTLDLYVSRLSEQEQPA